MESEGLKEEQRRYCLSSPGMNRKPEFENKKTFETLFRTLNSHFLSILYSSLDLLCHVAMKHGSAKRQITYVTGLESVILNDSNRQRTNEKLQLHDSQ